MQHDLFSVQDKIVVITGAFGQIGIEFSRAFLEGGARVALISRSASTDLLRKHFPQAHEAKKALAVPIDITDQRSIETGLAIIEQNWGAPHVLINNAGLDTQPSAPPEVSGPFEEFPVEVFREVVDINLVGTFLMTQQVGKLMRNADIAGSIINIGSIYGMVSPIQDIYKFREEDTGIPFIKPVAYSAAKSGIYNLTRYCATYWARHGIRVNTLTPSGVYRESQDARFIQNYTQRIPIGRMAEAHEFNGGAIFLASAASQYMTGANLVIDGGWTAW